MLHNKPTIEDPPMKSA